MAVDAGDTRPTARYLARTAQAWAGCLHAACLLLFIVVCLPAARAQGPAAVAHLDPQQFVGSWYELARFPNKIEKSCFSDAIVLYTLADKPPRFAVVNSCRRQDGSIDTRNAKGKPQDKSGDGKLKIAYTWPFYKQFWVLALAPDAQWALLGSPQHKYLWILSHTPTLPDATLAEIKSQAAAQGFDAAKLMMYPQSSQTH